LIFIQLCVWFSPCLRASVVGLFLICVDLRNLRRRVLLFPDPRLSALIRGKLCLVFSVSPCLRGRFYLRNLRLRARHLIFFSHFSQQGPKKTNKTFYTASPFAYMFVRDEPICHKPIAICQLLMASTNGQRRCHQHRTPP